MDNNDNWLNQNPSEKKQPDISSIPDINSIPDIAGFDQNKEKAKIDINNNVNQANSFEQPQYSNQQKSFSNYAQDTKANSYTGIKLNIPNSGGILSLGILSILSLCCCGGFLAPILSIIALIMTSKAMKAYNQNPDYYTISSLNNIKAGKITAIIGLVFAGLFLAYIIVVYTLGNLSLNDVNEAINEGWNGTGY